MNSLVAFTSEKNPDGDKGKTSEYTLDRKLWQQWRHTHMLIKLLLKAVSFSFPVSLDSEMLKNNPDGDKGDIRTC